MRNVFFEEDSAFRVGSIRSESGVSLMVENAHGKRSKVKANAVLLHFDGPLAGFMEQAQQLAEGIGAGFLWECCAEQEFTFQDLARDYFGREPSALEAASVLLRLHASPMYFYRKGKGHYKAAPADALKTALQGLERKRQQALKQEAYVAQLLKFALPQEYQPVLKSLLYKPDKASLEYRALDAAAQACGLSPIRLLEKCQAFSSPYDYHLQGFLFDYFPEGTGFGEAEIRFDGPQRLPVADGEAFSIDDATTTEIDDAFSVKRLDNGNWQAGIHIAAPALGIASGTIADTIARQRLSTVYIPGDKITMLPEAVIERFTLKVGRQCPVLSMYLEVSSKDHSVLASRSAVEEVRVVANYAHDPLEAFFASPANPAHAHGEALNVLHALASQMEDARGRVESMMLAPEYKFIVDGQRITILPRPRGTPVDKIVAELMIFVNSSWAQMLAQNAFAAIYRVQEAGRVRMTTQPGAHEGLGVDHYVWASSPLRRYVDLVNQRQLLSLLQGLPPAYVENEELFAIMGDFDSTYNAYAEFQKTMERYWCLRYIQQESITLTPATVLRDDLVRLDRLPLTARIPGMPPLPAGTVVEVELSNVDLVELHFSCRFKRTLETDESTTPETV